MRRGEIWWAHLPAPVGYRPVVLLSRNAAYERREFITIAPISTRIRNIKAEVSLGRAEGLRKKSVANLDTLNTIAKAALDKKIASLSGDKMLEIEEAIRFALGFSAAR